MTAHLARRLVRRLFGNPLPSRETVQEYFARRGGSFAPERYETIHPEATVTNPLPMNVGSRLELPDDRGWWGYSFRDVPARVSGETFVATLSDCLVLWYRDPAMGDDFYPAIVTGDGRALDMREIRFRPLHAQRLRHRASAARVRKATWVLERVYHNHSHWLTAHLPKLLLLRARQGLRDVPLPPDRNAARAASLRLTGFDPETFGTFDPDRPLHVEELTVVGTDRFRPELLRLVPEACGIAGSSSPWRKVFISRARATRRRLLNEGDVWARLERNGFERVSMEDLPFGDQVRLMRETAVLVAPHGAGLTNMMFCAPGAHVVEIADLGFPNPNFYALACALGHHYWIVRAQSLGEGHPLEKDLVADPEAVATLLPRLGEHDRRTRFAESGVLRGV